MLLLETVQTVALTHDIAKVFVIGFTDPATLNVIGIVWLSITLMTGMSAYVCLYQVQQPINKIGMSR